MKIRQVEREDIPALVEIYRYYVENTDITFEYVPPSQEEFTRRVQEITARYPYLVAEEEGEILGYAYGAAFKGRAAYDWSVETTVYVNWEKRGRGVGTRLYRELERELREQNIQNANACITYPNQGSMSFHEKEGYRLAAHFEKCGYKLGRWLDMIWMEKLIGSHPEDPGKVLWKNRRF
ncbi:MAG: GNAT family N-acetyltransferase [Eubacteriales bacterium]|nr:GNAT family N-acetyltransferase [Eubacteriales bacterium]